MIINDNKYDIREFNEWLKEQNSSEINWVIDSSIEHGTIKKYFFDSVDEVRQCQPSLVWNLTIVQKWIDTKDLNSKKEKAMEQFKAENYNSINDVRGYSTGYYKSKDGNTIAWSTTCKCQRPFYQLWKIYSVDCEQCNEMKELKKEVKNLEEKLELAKVNHEEFIDKSQNWHREQLTQKDEENNHLKNKLQILEKRLEKAGINLTEDEKSFTEFKFSFQN